MNDVTKTKGKFQLVVEIAGSMPEASRADVVAVIQEKLGTNKKNASTYFGRYLKEVVNPSVTSDEAETEEPSDLTSEVLS